MLHPSAIVVGSPFRVITHPDENHTVAVGVIPVFTHPLGLYPCEAFDRYCKMP
jgi:hypothetical protein